MSEGIAIKEYIFTPNQSLIDARKAAGWTQEELSLIADVSVGILGRAERINYSPSYDTKKRLAKALGKKVTELWPQHVDD